jgi:ABC-2 type transport system permease protein
MPGLVAIFEKELADHLGSIRFIILFALICVAGLWATYVASQAIRGAVSNPDVAKFVFLKLFTVSIVSPFSFVWFISFLGPLAGLALGFDAVNSERASGTLSRVISQPVYRDSFINGKFLAGLSTVAIMIACIMLILGGLGLMMMGVAPTGEEIGRLIAFFLISVVYVAVWMALAVLFSTVFRQGATSLLAGIALWIFMFLFVGAIASAVANAVVPVNSQSDLATQLSNAGISETVARISPTQLYQEAITPILAPNVNFADTSGYVQSYMSGAMQNPLPLSRSLLVVWPQITGLISLMVICFGAAYAVFMRQEIRA